MVLNLLSVIASCQEIDLTEIELTIVVFMLLPLEQSPRPFLKSTFPIFSANPRARVGIKFKKSVNDI